ncbi:AraC family transcriptional regulator [Flavivirga abyssicola]|uniref:helix-turn-helix domain-containing protein n=1 Tax=Flavivirga abyssicola TaxID=3063533 RepID=UPI0026E03FD1|nr:AraC family transcriptional regulator [Flavivirga sp. MEBiC07777]WVK11692.1 AraC family transcriptional regulator [Flavivirga sp. MEBiC07777]
MLTAYHVSEKLASYVAFLYTIKWEKTNYKVRIEEKALPSGTCFMVFQYKGRFKGKFESSIDGEEIKPQQFYTIGQQTDTYTMYSANEVIELTGAAFTPTGLYHLFGLNMTELVNNPVDTQTILDDSFDAFKQSYLSTELPRDRINYVENLLLNQLNMAKPKLTIIDEAVELIQQTKGCSLIKDITNKLNVSERYFQKKFKQMVGISPSIYSRIVRFNCLFAEMSSEGEQNYKTLSALFNYYDFAHFSKDFKRYCGMSPSKFHVERFKFLKEAWIDNRPFAY